MSRRRTFGDAGDELLPRRKKRSGADLDITPMIDVTFLLLIFFMVTSTMEQAAEVDVPTARHGVGVESLGVTVVMIKAGDPPVILLGEGSGAAEGNLDDVRRHVERGIALDQTQVIIKADREVPHGFVQEVARAVNSVEGVQFFIGVKDKKD